MTKDSLVNQNAYKIFAVIGVLILLATVFLSWTHLSKLEPYATELFERHILTELDLDSLNQQSLSLQRAIDSSQSAQDNPEAIKYSATQLQQLTLELDNLQKQIKDLRESLEKVKAEKQTLLRNIKIALALSMTGLAIGVLFAVIGFLGWYFDIKVFEERRRSPRE